ncbi:hypothetical protein OA430_02665 [Candidatus Pelagibacter sp.]|nr:hypothetical protein [Candidatus Pelagibacter sp.]
MQKIAEKNGGKCLSKTYLNQKHKLKWMCSEGHVWKAVPSTILYLNSWCPKCAGNQPLTIQDMHNTAKERGGKCLSKKYINNSTHLKWICSEQHEWTATPNTIRSGHWCPNCKYFHGEAICRITFETIFNKKFIKCRPKWLISSSGYPMELDGYCKYYNLAFEYQGRQHFDITYLSPNKKFLKKRIKDDKLKISLCKKHNIDLIVINYKDDLIKLPSIIKKRTKHIKFKGKYINFDQKIDFNKLYQHQSKIRDMQKLAEKNKGKCLSDKFISNTLNLRWMCSDGHEWAATPKNIKKGRWCPKCAGKQPLTIQDMHNTAKERGGKCLSKKYINNKIKLKWMCDKGHIWKAKSDNVRSGSWCPECAGNIRLNIKDIHNHAEEKGGKCLSKKYINNRTKLKFICAKGHIWKTTSDSLINAKTWCPICAIEFKANLLRKFN